MELHQWSFISSVILLCMDIVGTQTKSIHFDLFRLTPEEKKLTLAKHSNQGTQIPNLFQLTPEEKKLTLAKPPSNQETQIPKVCTTDQCKKSAEYILRNMNINVLPCHNFHEFACGNYHKWHPIPDYIDRMNAFRDREEFLLRVSADALKKRTYEDDTAPSIRKARVVFESCMNEEAMEKHGDLPIPVELNTLGLPIEPPFFDSVDRSYNLSKLLAKMHRYTVMGKFLFDVTVYADEVNNNNNIFTFDFTPPVTKFDAEEESNEEILKNHRNINRRRSYVSVEIQREALVEYMTKVINYVRENISGTFEEDAKTSITKEVAEVADFLIAVEQTKKKESVKIEDYFDSSTRTTIPTLQKITDEIFQSGNKKLKIDWLDYTETLFEGIYDDVRHGFENGETVVVRNIDQWKSVLQLVSNISEDVMIRAIWWMTVEPLTPYGTKALRKIRKEFHAQIKKSKKYRREHKCIVLVRNHFPFVLGHILLKQMKNPEQLRENVIAMVDNIHRAFDDTMTNNYWMDTATKMATLNKLHSITRLIAYQNWMLHAETLETLYGNVYPIIPVLWLEISTRVIAKYEVYPNSLYLNRKNIRRVMRLRALRYLRMFNDYSQGKASTNLRAEPQARWELYDACNLTSVFARGPTDPTKANGGYFPFLNTIDIPISLLGPPFYDLGLDSLNYGAIGVILGHEMGHAFDNFGRRFNSLGKRVRWWKKTTLEMYQFFETCFINEYNNFRIPGINKMVDGHLTLGENIADIMGFSQALKAYRFYTGKKEKISLPGLELYSQEKLFTLAFANLFCDNVEPSYREWQLSVDEHSPGPARVNGIARNSRDFARIWNCSSKTYMNPPKKCVLW